MQGHYIPHTAETKLKCSIAQKRRWLLGFYKNRINITPESIEKGRNTQRKGKFIKCIVCNKEFYCSPIIIKKGRKYCSRECFFKYNIGINHPRWTGNFKEYKHYRIKKYKDWRTSVFKRDNYTCQMCNKKGVFLHPHHIKSYTYFPKLRYEILNGVTLCINCHRNIHSLIGNIRRCLKLAL
jgi:hypothetical protein